VWGEERLPAWCRAGGYDWVLASDVCYDSERFQPLLDSILQLSALSPDAKVGKQYLPAFQRTLQPVVSKLMRYYSSSTVLRVCWCMCGLLGSLLTCTLQFTGGHVAAGPH
jgi:Lysine methyltransferase